MKRKKLLKRLAKWLDAGARKQRKHRDELEELLQKLEEKKDDLEEKLRSEKDSGKEKRLRKELEVLVAQRDKGLRALQRLAERG